MKRTTYPIWGLTILTLFVMLVSGCAPVQPAPQTTEAPAQPAATEAPAQPAATEAPAQPAATEAPAEPAATEAPPAAALTAQGRELPEDAAALDKQVVVLMGREGIYLDRSKSIWKRQFDTHLVSEPLTRRDRNYEVVPGAAERWEVSEDGLVWTFHLQQDLVWSDGKPLTAHDFEYTFKRMANPETGFDVGWLWGWVKNFTDAIEGKIPYDQVGVKAVDDYTLQIETAGVIPYAPMMVPDAEPVPQHVVEEFGDTWATDATHRISSGPYLLESWDKGKQLVFVINPSYKGPHKPFIQKIIYKVGEDAAVFPSYEAGEIDSIFEVYEGALSQSDIARIQADPVLSKEYYTHPFFMTWWIAFGGDDTAFKDVKVRQAFAHAIDRDALISGVLQGMGAPAVGILPTGFHCSSPAALQGLQNYDVEKAQQLLAEAGFPNGEGFPEYTLSLRAASPAIVLVGEALQAMIKQNLGISLKIENLDRKLFMEKLNAYQLPIVLIPWEMDFYDASNFMDIYLTGGRHPWSSAQYDELVKKADNTVEDAARCEMYSQAEQLLVGDAGGVFIWHPTVPQMWKPYIRGVPLEEMNRFGFVEWLEPIKGTTFVDIYVTK